MTRDLEDIIQDLYYLLGLWDEMLIMNEWIACTTCFLIENWNLTGCIIKEVITLIMVHIFFLLAHKIKKNLIIKKLKKNSMKKK